MDDGRRRLTSYPIPNTGLVIKVNDCVRMRPWSPRERSYVGVILAFLVDNTKNEVKVRVQWYYRPEETPAVRERYHGRQEVFRSEHIDIQNVLSIEAKCKLHSYEEYMNLDCISLNDFYWRYNYNPRTLSFHPDPTVDSKYCYCQQPKNPDKRMVQCDHCSDWFHTACLGMSDDEAEHLQKFECAKCVNAH